MSPPSPPSPRRERIHRSSVAPQEPSAATTDCYDSETFPILLRLPDVYALRAEPGEPSAHAGDAMVPPGVGSRHAPTRVAARRVVSGPGMAAGGVQLPASPAAKSWEQADRRPQPFDPEIKLAQHSGKGPVPTSAVVNRGGTARAALRNRRRAAGDDVPAWWPGVRRFLFVALVAAALLVVITTMARRHRPARSLPTPAPSKPAAASVPDAATLSAGGAASASGPMGATPVVPDATRYADGVTVGAVPYVYPSTSREPVSPELRAPSAPTPAGWSLPASEPALHGPDRTAPAASPPLR